MKLSGSRNNFHIFRNVNEEWKKKNSISIGNEWGDENEKTQKNTKTTQPRHDKSLNKMSNRKKNKNKKANFFHAKVINQLSEVESSKRLKEEGKSVRRIWWLIFFILLPSFFLLYFMLM